MLIKVLGWLVFKAELLQKSVEEYARHLHELRSERLEKRRQRKLLAMDAAEVGREKSLEAVILAGQITAAKRNNSLAEKNSTG